MLSWNDAVPDRKSILLCVEIFRTTGLVLKKSPGRPQSAQTSENAQTVRQSVMQSPKHSTSKHASALGLPDQKKKKW